MIVIEGLDNTGKTTLAEQLCKEFKLLNFNPSIGNKHDIDQITRQAWEQADEASPYELWDRSRIISEYVYNPVLQSRPLAFSPHDMLTMLDRFLIRPQLIIYCRRPLWRIRETFDEREQLGGVADKLDELDGAYQGFMWLLDTLAVSWNAELTIVPYDYEDPQGFTTVYTAVHDYLKEAV